MRRPTPWRALHRRSQDRSKDALLGISIGTEAPLAFPDPGCLAGILLSIRECSTSGLLGTHSVWRQQKETVDRSPDLPSNCSSLRDLDCTHSNYETRKSPVSVFIVTTSPYRDWVICAPAAFLGCGSRFSGSLSGIEP